jgi:general secretion pathway protein J
MVQIVHPRSATRYPLKGTTPAAWQSQFRGVSCTDMARRTPQRTPIQAPSRGFTLVEVLVAITILSMLALLSWRALDGMTRTQTITQQRADELLRLQAALGQWSADLDAVVETGEVTALDFNGRVLRMTRRDSTEIGLHSPGLRVVAWARHDGRDVTDGSPAATSARWMRWQSPPITRRDQLARAWERAADWGQGSTRGTGNSPDGGSDGEIALLPIDQWQLFYHRGETWGNPLSSVGRESTGGVVTGQTQLPNGVRLILTLSAGQGVTGELVRDWVRPALQGSLP